MSKILDVKLLPDSASVRHCLINYTGASQAAPTVTRSREQAKAMADSILDLLKKKKVQFPDMVTKFTSDSGSFYDFPDPKNPQKKVKKKPADLGAYKWFKEGQMVPEFQAAAFNGKIGDMLVVETAYGFHILEVLQRGVESKRLRLGTVQKTVLPSPNTKNEVYNQVLDFIAKYGTDSGAFYQGVKEKGLNMQVSTFAEKQEKQQRQ